MACLRCEDRPEGRWIYVAGELDHLGYEELAQEFKAAVREALGIVVVDLAGVTFAGSLAVRMLLQAHASLGRKGHALFLSDMTARVRRTLETVGVFELIPEWKGRKRDGSS